MFYVPFSYGRVLSRRPLPATAVSHVRLRSATADDLAVFDITICDEHGEEAAVVESFTMRRISGSTALTSLRRTDSPIAEPAGIESTVGAAMREGILPSEGVDAFDRIVASGLAVQVVASSVDVDAWMAKVDAEAAASDDDGRRRRSAVRATEHQRRLRAAGHADRARAGARCGAACSASSGSVATTTSSSSAVSR